MSDNPYQSSNLPPVLPSKGPTPPTKGAIPAWAWIFVVACGIIPVLALGGAIPMALGFGGGAGCVAIARNPTSPIAVRVSICIGITIACWALFAALIVVIAVVRQG